MRASPSSTDRRCLIRRLILAALAAVLIMPVAAPAPASAHTGCHSQACKQRVEIRVAHTKWRVAVANYGPGLLRARVACESLTSGGYRLSTTGNGYWFAHQFDVQAWTGAGGRMRHGRPAGVWSMQPEQLEQDYRAVVWDRKHGGDPWPNCP